MCLTDNDSAVQLLFGCHLLNYQSIEVLEGSSFKNDLGELFLVKQINQVKLAMAAGRTVVLLNHDHIFEALYDVLNQRFITRIDPYSTYP